MTDSTDLSDPDHSDPNGHYVECDCDLCDPTDAIGFYTCTCDQCDPLFLYESYITCISRHRRVCDCSGRIENCPRYKHIYVGCSTVISYTQICSCSYCTYAPIQKCENGCPVCSCELFVAYMHARYVASINEDQPAILAAQESKLFKYEIEQWTFPKSMWVVATSKRPQYPGQISFVLNIAEGLDEIREMISAESKLDDPEIPKPRKWSDIPKQLSSQYHQTMIASCIPILTVPLMNIESNIII